MRPRFMSLTLAVLGALLCTTQVMAQTCSIGGHNETSENFAAATWPTISLTPGSAPPLSGSHLLISEVAPRGCGLGAGSDSSEFIEIYNPTPSPVRLDGKYLSDDIGYYRIVNGTYAVTNATDWALRFPAGLALLPGRTLLLCVTKAGFAASGGTPGGAQIFLEMKDSNANTSDDMVIMTPNSTFPLTGGNLTNPSSTNGEFVVLYCWDGASDLVCDIDYASFGANSASNPKVDKTGVSIDGPDAGAIASAYNPDTPAASQSNLGSGTTLTKPLTYQRVGPESGESTLGGNGCVGKVIPSVIDWLPVAGAGGEANIRFHVRWQNPDDDAMSTPFSGQMMSQGFGVFQPDFGPIGSFNVPPLQPNSFFDVFFEVPLSALPPQPQKLTPGPGAPGFQLESRGAAALLADCPPDTNWAGNVDIVWSGSGQGGQVNKHYADLFTCAGGAPSYIHFRGTNCTAPMPWSLSGVCAGFSVTLVNEDFTPAPNPVPVGWTGWICVSAAAGVPSGTSCCFGVTFQCLGVTSTIDICSVACNCAPNPVPPTLTAVDWTTSGGVVTFHQHWENQSTSAPSAPVSGDMSSQALGVFLPNFGPIGHFDVPPIAPGSFFDVFIDVPLAQLPPEPVRQLPPGLAGTPCLPNQWHGNVDLIWASAGGTGNANYHFDEVPLCPGSRSLVHIETGCASPVGATWSVVGLCPGFTATLLNPDHTPAPNPLPFNWNGFIAVTAAAGTPVGTTCCFRIEFLCDSVPAAITVCAKVCDCNPRRPRLHHIDWRKVGTNVRFHMEWANPDSAGDSEPVSGDMNSQLFGAFLPDFGPIGHFDVPPIPPSSFFDVFIEVPLASLPPEPQEQLPGGGPVAGDPCPEDTSWSGNVDINWAGASGASQTNYHFTNLLVRPGSGTSHIHALIFCNSTLGSNWSIAGLCPGFTATLLNEDFTPAPNPVPPNWTGWISVGASAAVPPGTTCCFSVTFLCDTEAGVIDVCASTCQWAGNTEVPGHTGMDFGIRSTTPNPTNAGMAIGFSLSQGGKAKVEIYNLGGQRVRTLLDGNAEAGMNTVRWDGRGDNGRALPPGAYFVALKAGPQVASRKIVLFH